MDLFDKNELNKLIRNPRELCISIYMPTYQKGPEVSQNAIRFKNALARAEERALELRKENVSDIFDQAGKRISDAGYWMNQDRGLAVFLSRNTFSFYRMPMEFEDLVVVNDRFHLKPLLPLFATDSSFFILSVTMKAVQLFECTRHNIGRISVKNMPKGIDDALKFDQQNMQVQFYTGTPGSSPGKKRPALFHGMGVSGHSENDQLIRYFQAVNEALHPVLNDETRPLLFAGLDHYFPLYRQTNTYPYLITDAALRKNPGPMSDNELLEQAWEIMVSFFQEDFKAAADKYGNFKGTGRTGVDIKDIVERAIHGRVEYLFVGLGVHQWGKYHPETNEVVLHDRKMDSDEDLLDLAAFQTIVTGGKVFAVKADEVPDKSYAAAFYRY